MVARSEVFMRYAIKAGTRYVKFSGGAIIWVTSIKDATQYKTHKKAEEGLGRIVTSTHGEPEIVRVPK